MKISIIVPIYNVERELPRCVDSLVGQTYKEIEVVLVDDGSEDGCPALCDGYAAVDGRVRVVHKENGGLSDARNAGRRAATGDYVLYVDSDDWIERDACERLSRVAMATDADLVAFEGVHELPGEDVSMPRTGFSDGEVCATRDFVTRSIGTREWYASACLYMYSSHLYRHATSKGDALYFKKGILHEDMEMQPRLFSMAESVACCAGPLYHYVEREGSIMTGRWTQRRLDDMRSIFEGWKVAYEAVEDEGYREALLGHFAKCWLTTCRVSGRPETLRIEGVDWRYLFEHGLDFKEKAKALLFGLSPSLYVGVGRAVK